MSKHSKSLHLVHAILVLTIIGISFLSLQFAQDSDNLTGAATGNGDLSGSVTPYIESASINSTTPLQNSTYDNITTHISSNAKNIINWYLNDSSIHALNLPFEGVNQTSDKNAFDYSPNSFNGTVNNAIWNEVGGFDGNGSYDFNGSSDYITFADNDALDFGTGDFSYMMWFKGYQGVPGNIQLLSKRAAGSGNYELQVESTGNLVAYAEDSGSSSSIASQTSTSSFIGVWTHVAVVRETGVLKLYVNGELENSTASSQNVDSSSVLSIGRDPVGSDEYFNGTIDEVQIFNISLTDNQVRAIFNNQTFIHSNQTDIGDQWSFCVTPNANKQDGSTTCSSSLTVLSTPPSVSSALINSTTPTINSTDDNVTAHVTTTDPNGDSVRSIYQWQRNGTETMVLNMPFERVDRTDSDNAYDYSINQNAGVESVSIVWNQTGGIEGTGAYDFDGVDDSITASYISDYDITTELTVSAWIKPDRAGYGDWETIVMKGTDQTLANENFNYNLRITDDGNLQFSVNGSTSGYSFASSGDIIQNDSWSLVTGVFNSTDINVYINGSSVGTFALSEPITTSTSDIKIGNFDNDIFKGIIDEVQIYNIALEQSQVEALYLAYNDIITSDQTSQGDNWSYCVTPNDGWENGKSACSENISINYKPSTPELVAPVNSDTTTDRSPYFAWNSSTDADGDSISYRIEIVNTSNPGQNFVDVSSIPDNGTTQSNYTYESDLLTDISYSWRITAFDGKEYGSSSDIFEFQVLSSNVITLPTNAVNFSEITSQEDKNTTSGSGLQPLLISNDGNIALDIYLNSTSMFVKNDSKWQFQFEANETNAYTFANESWTNFTINTTDELSLTSLWYENGSNTANRANLHLLVQVAADEPPGEASSTIYVRSEASP